MFEPNNEMGVVVRFAQVCDEYGAEIVSIQSAYPDAIIRIGEEEYRVEFEYYASNFIQHRHDPRKCDLVICWVDDLKGTDFPLTVWELASPLTPVIKNVDEKDKELAYLRAENKYLRRKLDIEEEEKERNLPSSFRIEQAARTLEAELNRQPSVREIQQRLRSEDGTDTGWSTSTISGALKK